MKLMKASLYLGIALAVSACSEQVTVETRLENAKSYLSQNLMNESIIELKNAIRADNKNAEARFLLGKTYLNLGDGAAAVKELERAKTFTYDKNKVIPLLARAYILTDSDVDVLDLNEVSTTLDKNAQSQYLAYKTLASLRSNKLEQAKESVSLAQSIESENLYSLLASAYLSVSEQQFDSANSLLAEVFTINAQQVDALMLHAQLSMLTQNYQQAATSFKKYLTLQPRSGVVKLLLSDALLKSGQFDEAENYADSILAQVPNQPFAHYIKAMVAFNAKNFEAASEHAELAISANFNQLNLKLVAGASAFYLKNWQQSHHHLVDIVKYLPKEHQARRMLAVTQLELGLIDEIGTTIGDLKDESIDNSQFRSLMSYKLLELGATDEAQKLLAQSSEDHLNNASHSARQGILKLMMNDLSGIQYLEKAIALDPDFIGAEVALAYAALQTNDVEKAKDIAANWQERSPEQAGSYTLMASIAMKEQKYDQAETLLEKSLSLEPDNIFALTEQLKVARLQKNEPLSRERAEHLISIAPNNNKVLRHYFGLYQNEMALSKLQLAYQASKNNIQKALLVAEAMMNLSQYKEAESLLNSIAEEPKLPKRYWQLLIINHKKQNQNDKVQSTLESWSKASPYHLEPITLLADLYASRGDNEHALKVIKSGLAYHKDNLLLQLTQMQLLLNDKQIFPAKKLYKTLVAADINVALKQGFAGRILLLEGEYKEALPKLISLYEAYPSSQNALYIAQAYISNKQEAKAVDVLETHVKTDENAHQINTLLAGIYLKNDTVKAIGTYENIVEKQPRNVVAHNNLAWLYLEQNQLDKALEHAATSFELAPHIANVVDTYAQVLLGKGDNRAALKYATEAYELTEGKDVSIQLNYAEALITNGRLNEAKDTLSEIITVTDEQKKKKEKLIIRL